MERADRKPWAVLAYTVADDRSDGDSLDSAAKEELKAICNAADFGQMSVAAQVDFKHTRGVFRGVLTEAPPKRRGFANIPADSHPLWRGIKAKLERSKLRVQKDETDLNAARASVLAQFLRYGARECPAERYVLFFYGHGYGPLGLFFDAEADDAADRRTLALDGLADSLTSAAARTAVMVFRSCLAGTLEAAYQLRGAAEYMIASPSIVPIAGVWPWGTFVTTLMPGASSRDVALAIARQLALFLEEPANRDPFADVPYSLLELAAAESVVAPLTALAGALDAARRDARLAGLCARALEASRVGYPDDPAHPGDPALLDVPTMCDRLGAIGAPDIAGPARTLGEVVGGRLVAWHHSRRRVHRGLGLYYKPVSAAGKRRSHLFDEGMAAADDAAYRRLALSVATGWDRIALNPFA